MKRESTNSKVKIRLDNLKYGFHGINKWSQSKISETSPGPMFKNSMNKSQHGYLNMIKKNPSTFSINEDLENVDASHKDS